MQVVGEPQGVAAPDAFLVWGCGEVRRASVQRLRRVFAAAASPRAAALASSTSSAARGYSSASLIRPAKPVTSR